MRERHFARMRHAASAADQTGRRSRVMRRAERPMRHEGATVGQQAGDRRNARDFERLLLAHRRQDVGQPAREHGLPAAGRTDHQQVVAAGRSDPERALGDDVPADVGQIQSAPVLRNVRMSVHRLDVAFSAKEPDRLCEVRDGKHLEARHQRRLRCVRGRYHHRARAGVRGSDRSGEHPADAADAAV